MAADIMQGLVSEAKRNRFSTLPRLSDEDVVAVWDMVSAFIESNMSQQKGVCIPGLGVFTFTQKKLDVGGNKYILIQRPVFALSEKFAATHALQVTKYHTTGQIPVVQLNFAALSNETAFDRDTVEGCVKEMLQAFSRSIQNKKCVEFVFCGIGRLSIRDSKVKMKFYKEFLQSMDGSGNLVKALTNRPYTTDSVLSGHVTPDHRPLTSNTLVLPRITPGMDLSKEDTSNKVMMPTICEEGTKSGDDVCLEGGRQSNCGTVKTQILNLENEEERFSETEQVNSAPPRLQNSAEQLQSPKKGLSSPGSLGNVDTKFDQRFTANSTSNLQRGAVEQPNIPQTAPKLIRGSSLGHSCPRQPRTASGTRDHNKESLARPRNSAVPPKTAYPRSKVFDKSCSGCLHAAGQELCYLCYQREKRNYPVYHSEEKRQKELEEDRLLQQYQQLKDSEAMMREQGLKEQNRDESSKIAAFNLGVAEAVKAKKFERPTSFHRSYVFHRRPVTPPHYIKQEEYCEDLAKQVRKKKDQDKKETKERDFLERLEQVQLAEDLALQREQYLKNKRLQSEEYRKALDTQVRFKPLPMPSAVADSDAPLFGIHDLNHEKLDERRQRARKLYEDQLQMAAEKQRQTILRDLNNQKDEIEMLHRTKKELFQEMTDRNDKRLRKQKDLEDNWANAARLKKEREADETLRAQTPGVLIHEQCHKYRRCKLCQRHLGNSGESNVWSESRYVPGSRLIV